MSRLVRDFRLLPLVLIAAVALLVLKSFGLLLDGGYLLGPPATQQGAKFTEGPGSGGGDIVGSIPKPAAKPERVVPDAPLVTAPVIAGAQPDSSPSKRRSWAQEMFNYPDITGSVGAKKDAEPAARAKEAAPQKANASKDGATPPPPSQPALGMPNTRPISPSERVILERLQERRKDLEARARELDMRETLLKATEKQLEGRVKELKQAEGLTSGGGGKTGEEAALRFKGLVSMYENMKAKDAARIFDRLDLKILAELAGRINPRRMGDILANMSPEAAERLTIEFASRGQASKSPSPADLPKIEGRPASKR